MKSTIRISESPDSWEITATELHLSQYRIGAGLELMLRQVHGEGFFSIRVSGEFNLISNGKQFKLDAEKPKEIGQVFDLLSVHISKIVISKTGEIEISFSNTDKIVVNPDPHYEAWQACINDTHFVCSPGGGDVVVWDPKASQLEVK